MKIWKMFVIVGGVIGLGMIPILDVLVYFAPSRYPHSPELLVEALLTYAQLYSFVKYLLVAVGPGRENDAAGEAVQHRRQCEHGDHVESPHDDSLAAPVVQERLGHGYDPSKIRWSITAALTGLGANDAMRMARCITRFSLSR